MFILNSKEPIKFTHLQKIAQSVNVDWHTCDRTGNNSFSGSKKNFDRLIKRGTF